MKIAIIGAGGIGALHAELLCKQGTPPTLICDIDRDRALALAARFAPAASIYTDWQKMLECESLDAVHICTPHYLHAPMVIAALQRGIHVLCEKPLCISPAELNAILAAEQASAAQLGVCLQNRYLQASRYAKNYLADKSIVSAHGTVVWKRTAEYYRSAAWRGTRAMEGGGVLINQALHTLDLLGWFCGEQEYVTARADNLSLQGEIEVEDTLSAIFVGKQPFSFFATNAGAADMTIQITLQLSNGETMQVTPDLVSLNGQISLQNRDSTYLGKPCYGNGHELLLADFYGCLRAGKHFPIDGAEAARVMRLIFSAYGSNGQKIKILQ